MMRPEAAVGAATDGEGETIYESCGHAHRADEGLAH